MDIYSLWVSKIIVLLSLGFLSLILIAGLRKVSRNLRSHYNKRKLNQYREVINQYLHSPDPKIAKKIPKTYSIKNYLSELATKFSGELQLEILKLYRSIGFAAQDLALLNSSSSRIKLQALIRLSRVSANIPKEVHEKLTKDPSLAVRWKIMEIKIVQARSLSFLPVIEFLRAPENRKSRGIIIHLLTLLLTYSPEALRFILTHVEDELLIEAVLRSAQSIKSSDFADLIPDIIFRSRNNEVIIQAIKLLQQQKEVEHHQVYNSLARHQS